MFLAIFTRRVLIFRAVTSFINSLCLSDIVDFQIVIPLSGLCQRCVLFHDFGPQKSYDHQSIEMLQGLIFFF